MPILPRVLYRLAAGLGLVVLAACAPPGPRPVLPADAAPRALAPGEIRTVLTAHTLERDGVQEQMAWRYANRHLADGRLLARLWLDGTVAEEREGSWEIDETGRYCRTWPARDGVLKQGCFTVSQAGGLVVLDHAGGARGSDARHVYRLLPGDPAGLESSS